MAAESTRMHTETGRAVGGAGGNPAGTGGGWSGRRARVGGRGFTLVELMVVLVIIGLMATAVMLTAPDSGDALDGQATTLSTLLVRAREEAILGTRAIEVTVTAHGYGFARQSFGDWQPLRDGPFDDRLWPAGVAPVFAPGREQLVFRFDPTGAAVEQALVLAGATGQARIGVDAAGEVEIDGPR